MTENGLSLGLMANWLSSIIIALITRPLFQILNGWLFIIFAGINFVSIIFVLMFVKETKGKTDIEIASLYTDKSKILTDV